MRLKQSALRKAFVLGFSIIIAAAGVLALEYKLTSTQARIASVPTPAVENKFCDDPASASQARCVGFIPNVLAATNTNTSPYQTVTGPVSIGGDINFGPALNNGDAWLQSIPNGTSSVFFIGNGTQKVWNNTTGANGGAMITLWSNGSWQPGLLELWGGGGGAATRMINSNAPAGTFWKVGPDANNNFVVYNQGDQGVWLDKNGAGNTSPFWHANSDQRLKTNIQALDSNSGLNAILALNPVSFNWVNTKAGNKTQIGFIAQEVQKIFPDFVSNGPDAKITLPDGSEKTIEKPLGLSYESFVPSLVKAIQEQQKQIEDLQRQIKELEHR